MKSKIQNAISLLPSAASYEAYYWVQRHYGGLRHVDPIMGFNAAIETWTRIQNQDQSPIGKVFLEVGTGRAPIVPIAYWLMGAKSTITIDLNPYLKEDLIAEHLRYIAKNKDKTIALFGSLIDKQRFDALVSIATKSKLSVSELLDLCKIVYIAPGDASNTNLPDQHIDFHTSYTVFEHIPPNILTAILREGNRIIKNNGLFVHRIDYSDHFSHSDENISAINFLQYSDNEWAKYADNRYMYMNRLRHDDFLALFESIGQQVVASEPDIDKRSEKLLKTNGLSLNERFSLKSEEILAIRGAWMVTKKYG
ncbi:MAG: class I SAM-dependent methyltransferase [Balneolales bacterium]|nr:class I SAM-dependent methyltransferase [Balneolales bacterium]